MIEFKSISKRYGTSAQSPLAVDHINFSIPKGTLTTILGPSGCGKTTTLRMLAGLESPSSGEIWIDGQDVTRQGPAQRNVSMMFQSYALFPHMHVLDNVMYGLKMSGINKTEAIERATAMLKNVGLVGFDERLPAELSGGQQQRVALARALVLEPAVLLFDEPLSNLDSRLRRAMREEIRSLQQRLGLTVAYVTHDQAEALAVSDQIIVMHQGRIAQMGSPRDLYETPSNEFVASFMGEATLWPAQLQADGSVTLGAQNTLTWRPALASANTSANAQDVKLAVRPEAWDILPASSATGLAAKVNKSAYLGSVNEYHFDTEIGDIFVTSPSGQAAMAVGDSAKLQLATHGVALVESAQ